MLVRRVLILIPLLLGVVLFVFIIMRFSDNKPEYAYFEGANPTPAQIHQFQVDNGLCSIRCRCDTCASSAS
jgi:peptide/nickel transport system permease protein